MVFKIDKKIVGYKVVEKGKEAVVENLSSVTPNQKISGIVTESQVFTPEKINREPVISGKTYKIKPGNGDDGYYITINSQLVEGKLHPMEIFINSKNVEHFQWVSTITRLISAIFRKGGDYHFIVEELKAIHDPNGGYWGPKDPATGKRSFYKSILNEIGDVIDRYVNGLSVESETCVEFKIDDSEPSYPENATKCPDCGVTAVVLMDGCATCLDCGYSKCG